MGPEERLRLALGRRLWADLLETGHPYMFDQTIEALGNELEVPAHLTEHVTRLLVSDGRLYEKQHGFFDGTALALLYGERHARNEWRSMNDVCRRILRASIPGHEGDPSVWDDFTVDQDESTPPVDGSFGELAAAIRFLELLGYLELEMAGGNFHVRLRPPGYDLARDEAELRRAFPASATEDEAAHATVVPDVLDALITSCEGLLRNRNWTAALDELGRGDVAHRESNWVEAVREYYSAIESGLRYRITETGEEVAEGAALKRLATRAAELGLIPANYAALFVFVDSIRSPRSHGAGPKPVEVEVGPAESLLMGHQARALLVYLGQRP